jgi:nucleoside-diphosphate kinase
MIERTFVMIKPDGVKRALIGEIIKRFETVGLKLVGMRMTWVNAEFAKRHYPLDEEWARSLFEKNKNSAEKNGRPFEFSDHLEFGGLIQKRNMNYIIEGPVIAMVWEGIHAIEIVRKIVGSTEPRQAIPGTIRGDFTHVSYQYSDNKDISVRNLIHASSDPKAAEYEISLWFENKELHTYKNVHDISVY